MFEKPLSEFADSARSLLVGVQVSQRGGGPPARLVSSALSAEGKSTLCLALARLHKLGVQLDDLDLRRPAAPRPSRGLRD